MSCWAPNYRQSSGRELESLERVELYNAFV